MRKIKAASLAAAFCVLASLAARAQVSISAQVDRNEIGIGDQITLTVDVNGPNASLPDPQIPPMRNFSVYSSGRSQNISIINGHISSDLEYTYVLAPRYVGKSAIPPIALSYQGHTVKTSPISVDVLRSEPRSQAAPAQAQASM